MSYFIDLRLNASNDPVTAGLEINALTAAEPILVLQTLDDDATNPFMEMQKADNTVLHSIGQSAIQFQPAADSVTFFQILDANGGIPILNIDSTNERVGIGTAAPAEQLDVFGAGNAFRLSFDGANYANMSVAANGGLTIATIGANATIAEFGVSGAFSQFHFKSADAGATIKIENTGASSAFFTAAAVNAFCGFVLISAANAQQWNAGQQGSSSFSYTDATHAAKQPFILEADCDTNSFYIASPGFVGLNETNPGAQLQITISGTTIIGQIIKGAAAQTANLLELQESDGSIMLASGDGLGGSVFAGNIQLEDIDFVWSGITEANLFRVDAGAEETRMGDWDTNYVKVDKTGEMSFEGTATVWNDIFFPMSSGRIGGANQPTWAAFQGNTFEYTFAINDYIHLPSGEILHSYKEGSDIELHIHIVLDGSDAGDTDVNYEIEYTIGDLNEVMSAAAIITSGDYTITGGTADRTHIRIDIGTITGTNLLSMAALKMRFRRIALVGGGNAPGSDPFVLMAGAHIEEDTVGSRTEGAK